MRFCEFTGDEAHDFDEVGFKKACEHIGVVGRTGENVCLKHNKPIETCSAGWRLCCDECTEPVQVKQ